MQYEYEIAKLLPKQEFMRVVYKAEGYPDFNITMNPTDYDPAYLQQLIRDRAPQAISFWQRWEQHPENVDVDLSGSGNYEEPTIEPPTEPESLEVAPHPEYDIFTQRIQLQDEVNAESNAYEWDVIDLTAEEQSAFLQEWRQYASVTMRQARMALFSSGQLSSVDSAIASMPSPQKELAQIEWDYGSTIERTSPLVVGLGPALGLDSVALDDLFKIAGTL